MEMWLKWTLKRVFEGCIEISGPNMTTKYHEIRMCDIRIESIDRILQAYQKFSRGSRGIIGTWGYNVNTHDSFRILLFCD